MAQVYKTLYEMLSSEVSLSPQTLIPRKENAELSNSNDTDQMTAGQSYILISASITFKVKEINSGGRIA